MTDETIHYVNKAGKYLGAFTGVKPPRGAVAVEPHPARADQIWNFPGWGESFYEANIRESQFRTEAMAQALENITSIEFGDKSIPGTAAEWKEYWLALRDWVEGAEGYPAQGSRPKKPSK